MNAPRTHVTLAPRTPVNVPSRAESTSRHSQPSRYRARDSGIGYGASSGYKRYTSDWGQTRFQCR
ncbi:MAG: hypothetical protein HOP03_08740 [Lysobacter sp.]|nr:hypothetical protein [Lysobacter sp.]